MSQATPRRALIVIDVQNEYVTGDLPIEYPDVNVSLANIGRAMDAAHAASVPVVVVQNFAPATAPIFARGSEGAELHPIVGSRPRAHYLEKSLPSAFTGTDLADWLKANTIDTLTVVGYMTHNCDASTINHALHAGYAVEFLSDATGSVPYENAAGFASAEEIHRVFSVVLQSRFAAVLGTDEWIAGLASGALPQRGSIYASNQKARERRLRQKEAEQA
ncbi:cysteine hydrolase [Trinickia violacea]|uniref:Cysteine hydrolase n=1 Tax=Trinickia violacea TaxID=2571746 RepID=A0A4P8IKX1_9BURK|nr:cysteine hydrolase family protein [Trinickia violacea]QCP48377.1 cysteine hydrolase [Trinickia violacea]